MMAKERWDACDREGNPLGYTVVRGEPVPEGVWHRVAEVLSITTEGRVLITKRHPDKPWGGFWEYTGGSVLAGEEPQAGAARELREETGISLPEAALHPLYVDARLGIDGLNTIYCCFAAFFDPAEQTIRLQEGETVDFRLLPYDQFKEFLFTEEFTDPIRRRFLDHQEVFDRLMEAHLKK
ncbi:MAG: NUDIX domain-containing protein [Oscillospiraceae bacterium]|nr:NUDIX domain-containing protein [Oscillospiraceae bacterium]